MLAVLRLGQTAGQLGGRLDSFELARQAAQNFEVDPYWMEPNQTIREIAAKWAWDVAFRIRRGVRSGRYRHPSGRTWVLGVFAGLEPNGELAVAIGQLDYAEPRPGWVVPPVSVSVRIPVLPKDFTWIDVIGRDSVAAKYYSKHEITDETRNEHLRIRAEQLGNPRNFSPEVVKKLVELTLEKDEFEWPGGYKAVGGDIDRKWRADATNSPPHGRVIFEIVHLTDRDGLRSGAAECHEETDDQKPPYAKHALSPPWW